MNRIESIRQEIIAHPSNAWAKKLHYEPVFTAHKETKVVIIGQAPGIRAQTSHIPWDDASGRTLRQWLDVSDELFYDPRHIALIPMDFYFPGKGTSGDMAPRKDFAELWHEKLFQCMPKISLKILIGQYSQGYYLQEKKQKSLTERVQNYKQYLQEGIFPLPHPSPGNNIWMKKNPWFAEEVLARLKREVHAHLKK